MSAQAQRRRPQAAAILVSLIAALTMAGFSAGPVAAADNIKIAAWLGDCQFRGIGAGANKTVKIEWRDEQHNLKSKHSVTSNAAGQFTSKCDRGEEIEVGDMLSAQVGSGSPHVQGVLPLSASINRDADTVSIQDGMDGPVYVDLYTFNGSFDQLTLHSQTMSTRNVGGGYLADFSGVADIRGHDFVDVSWINERGDLIGLTRTAPGWTVWIGRAFVQAVGNPGSMFSATLKDGNGVVTYGRTGGVLWEGSNGFYLYDEYGRRAKVAAGNNLDADFDGAVAGFGRLPNITTTILKGSDTVYAYCGNHEIAGVEVAVYSRDGNGLAYRAGFVGDLQGFEARFSVSPKHNIVTGDKVDVYCKASSGDIVARRFTVP